MCTGRPIPLLTLAGDELGPARLRLIKRMIVKWRIRVFHQQFEGLLVDQRPEATRCIADGDVERVTRLTLERMRWDRVLAFYERRGRAEENA